MGRDMEIDFKMSSILINKSTLRQDVLEFNNNSMLNPFLYKL